MSFENLVDNISNFSYLNNAVPDNKAQERFVNAWRSKFTKIFKEGPPEEAYIWNIRTYKALKETFYSAHMYEEALVAMESNCTTSFYFLSYYSLFHAFLACITLIPEQSVENISEMNHSKILKVFRSTFCTSAPHIIDKSICDIFEMLKYYREFYSYHIPPNNFLKKRNDYIPPEKVLPDYLKACFQLTNMLSHIIFLSYSKHHKRIENKNAHLKLVRDNFFILNSRKHPRAKKHSPNQFKYPLDYVDKVRLKETYEYPSPVPLTIEFEHFTDEYGTYRGTEFPSYSDGRKISPSAFVYDAIF